VSAIAYQSARPCARLQPCVARYWQLESDGPVLDAPGRWALPDGGSEWVFVLADPLLRDAHVQRAGAHAAGTALAAYRSRPAGRVLTFGVVFRPGGAAAVSHLSADELAGRVVPLEFLWGAAASELAERLAGAVGFGARVELVQEELLARLRPMDAEVTEAIRRLAADPRVAVGRLTGDAAAARRLQRKFLAQVGVAPKRLARMFRLQLATRLHASGWTGGWAELASAAGYSDQAHLVRECRALAGTSPGGIAERPGLLSDSFKTRAR